MVLVDYANSWAAMNWFDLEGEGFQYLRQKIGKIQLQAYVQTIVFKNFRVDKQNKALPSVMSFDNAFRRYNQNRSLKLQLVRDDENGRIERRETLSIQDFDINAKAR